MYKRVLDDAITLTGSTVGFFHLIADDERTIALSTWGQETLGIDAASHVGHHPLEKAGI